MAQDIRPEDLIVTADDGSRKINHDVLVSYGLFNLPKPLMRNALMVYYDNAVRHGPGPTLAVRAFISLANAMARFPKPVAVNFTRGAAYRWNMKMLEKYSE